MKATLEFQLPEEQEDYDLVNQARNLYCVIYELEDYLRDLAKYKNQETINIDDLRQKIIDLKLEQGIKEYSWKTKYINFFKSLKALR